LNPRSEDKEALVMSKPHLPALDGLRALAVLMVIAHNVELFDIAVHEGLMAKVMTFLLDFGWVGVTLFFVLSGYLITGILLDARGKAGALVKFLARRGLRIFPLYYALLILEFAVLPALGAHPNLAEQNGWRQLWFWTYTVNWAGFFDPAWLPHGLPHLWSLAVEEQFYLVWPLLMLGMSSPKRAFQVSMGVALASALLRAAMVLQGFEHALIYDWTFTRVDALALGAAAAAAWRWPQAQQWVAVHRRTVGPVVIGIFLLSFVLTHGLNRMSASGQIWGYGMWALVFTWLVYAAAAADMGSIPSDVFVRMLRSPVLLRIGQVSYGMYLFHKPLHERFSAPVIKALGWPIESTVGAVIHVLAVMLVTYLLATLSYRHFEQPFLKLKDRFN
jgi:peptidoglycan/LPS O-acetylase OafA/YrhL